MGLEVEIELGGRRDLCSGGMHMRIDLDKITKRTAINNKTGGAIATAIPLTLLREETDWEDSEIVKRSKGLLTVMAFADDDHSELRDDGEVQRSTGSCEKNR